MADYSEHNTQNLDKELQRISKTIFDKATDTRAKMEEELIEKFRIEKKKRETEFLEEAYKLIQLDINKITNESNRQITSEKTLAKTKLMTLRNKITGEVYSEVEKRLAEFISSDAYHEWLLNSIKEETDKYESGEFIILINKSDAKHREMLEKELNTDKKSVKINFTDENIIGGAKIMNKATNMIIDNAIIDRFEQQKLEFLRTSGLSLNTI